MTVSASAIALDQCDFTIQKVSYHNPHAPQLFARSIRETGFAVITDHPIAPQLSEDVLSEWQSFFQSPTKQDHLYKPDTFLGYFPFGLENAKGAKSKNNLEYYHHHPLFRDLPGSISPKTNALFQGLVSLAETLLTWLDHDLPASIKNTLWSGSLPSMMVKDHFATVMRVLHYPKPVPGEQDIDIVNQEHADINLITLLCSATAPGLQVKDLSGNWHQVGYKTQDIIVNAGDMLQAATDFYYKSTPHRVVRVPGHDGVRYSIPLFVAPNPNAMLTKTLKAGDYFRTRMIENGVLADDGAVL